MSPPQVLGGRYAMGEVIGRGGMAVVHRGHDLGSGRSVAVKVLRTHLADDPLALTRFRREAQLLAGLGHPAIVTLLDTGHEEVEEGSAGRVSVPFIVMEHVPGRSLQDLIRSGGATPERSVHHLLGVLSALGSSHRAGVVHRDIKPANVMVTPDGAVKVVDFGIARSSEDSAATLTHLQAVMGTPGYLSPEQARGGVTDARSDLYSAGCLLFELLTGRPPFVGDDPVSVAYQHVHEEPPRLSTFDLDLAPALDAVLVTALAKDREARYQDARAFEDALRAATGGLVHHDGLTPRNSDRRSRTTRKEPPMGPATARRESSIPVAAQHERPGVGRPAVESHGSHRPEPQLHARLPGPSDGPAPDRPRLREGSR